MVVPPHTFVSGFNALLRVGFAARDAGEEVRLRRDFEVILPPQFRSTYEALLVRAVEHLFYADRDRLRFGAFSGLVDPATLDSEVMPGPRDEVDPDVADAAIEFMLEATGSPLEPWRIQAGETPLALPRTVVLQYKDWADPADGRIWKRFGWTLASTVVDLAAARSDRLGVGRRAGHIVGAIAPHLSAFMTEESAAGDEETTGERFLNFFVETALETVAARPELISSKARWRPLVAGVVEPLYKQIKEDGASEFFARGRLQDFLAGPGAHAVLTSLTGEAASLEGVVGADRLLGAVARQVFADVLAPGPQDFDVRRLITEDGAVGLYRSALSVAQERPQLFIRADGVESDALRGLLPRLAKTLRDAPPPYRAEDGLGADLAALALEAAGAYSERRMRGLFSSGGAAPMLSEVGAHLIGDLAAALGAGLEAKGAPHRFGELFSRAQAVDVLKIAARHAASTPGFIVGQGASFELKALMAGLAEAVASDEQGLLSAEDWRGVIATTLDLAAKNPGALLGVEGEAVTHRVGFDLVAQLLHTASARMGEAPRAPGKLLFGETLRTAITATLSAAASRIVAEGESEIQDRLTDLAAFVDVIEGVAADAGAKTHMSASDWADVYEHFIAHVLEGALDDVTPLAIEIYLRDLPVVQPVLPEVVS